MTTPLGLQKASFDFRPSADPDDASVQIDLISVLQLMIDEKPSATPNASRDRALAVPGVLPW
jgi:hypothetical protein